MTTSTKINWTRAVDHRTDEVHYTAGVAGLAARIIVARYGGPAARGGARSIVSACARDDAGRVVNYTEREHARAAEATAIRAHRQRLGALLRRHAGRVEANEQAARAELARIERDYGPAPTGGQA